MPILRMVTFSESSLPRATDSCIMLGILLKISEISSSREYIFFSKPSILVGISPASFNNFLASFPAFLASAISLEILFLSARKLSTSPLSSRHFLSFSSARSTNFNLSVLNFFLIFSLTLSGFSRKNLISNMYSQK